MDETNKENTSLTLTSSTFNTQLQITFTYPDTHNQEVFEVSRSGERQKSFACVDFCTHSSDKYHPRRRNQKKAIKVRRDVSAGGEEEKEGDGKEGGEANK